MGNYLVHHGILGQEWGKRNGPPYPLNSGAHSSSEKKAGWRQSLSDNVARRKKEKALKVEAKKQNKAKSSGPDISEMDDETKEKFKAKLLMSGDAASVYRNRKLFTNKELQAAIDRINMDVKLRDLSRAQNKTAGDHADDLIKWVDRGAKLYKTYSSVVITKNNLDKIKSGKKEEKK